MLAPVRKIVPTAWLIVLSLAGCNGSQLTDAQQERVDELDALQTIPISGPADELVSAIETFPISKVDEIDTALTIDASDIPPAAELALRRAIADFLSAYGSNDPGAVYDLMRASGESLTDDAVEALSSEVGRSGIDDDRKLFVDAWQAMACDPSWERFLKGSSKIVVWRCPSAAAFESMQPHTADQGIFLNVTNYRHVFSGDHTIRDEAKLRKKLIVADVQWGIEHTPARQSEKSLYFARFWWDSDNDRWRPNLLRYVATREGAQSSPPKLLF